MMQARWGSHGDYEIIALCAQLAAGVLRPDHQGLQPRPRRYRVPVLVMMDECVGHMTERVVIPPAEEIEIYPRRYTDGAARTSTCRTRRRRPGARRWPRPATATASTSPA